MNQALALEPQSPGRLAALGESESILTLALTQDSTIRPCCATWPWARSAHYDDAGALDALQQAAASPRLDAFDMLQIAHVYRDLGFAEDAYAWAARAYASWQRPPEDAVMQVYAQSTLAVLDDDRARTLADPGRSRDAGAHAFGEAQIALSAGADVQARQPVPAGPPRRAHQRGRSAKYGG